MSTNESLSALSAAGVSVWLDDLSRGAIASGELQRLIDERSVVGVTTNPTIFANALARGEEYADAIGELAKAGTSVDEAIFEVTTADVKAASKLFAPTFAASSGVDGRVSIEVSPELAHDTDGTIVEAKRLYAQVDEPNVLIKIPATKAGLPAITAVIGEGISVNVTLIFSLERYAEVIDAYLAGLEIAKAAGRDLGAIHSVASFFVSRVDTEVDKRIATLGADPSLKSQAGLANARLAYELFEQRFATPASIALIEAGANVQRPLWASTGVKDPALPDTLYVSGLVAANTVNTMPRATLEAFADHGVVEGDTITSTYAAARAHLDALEAVGISYDDVVQVLEDEGVSKFITSWGELKETVQTALNSAS